MDNNVHFIGQVYIKTYPEIESQVRFVFKTNLRALDFIIVAYVEKRATLPQNYSWKLMY